MVKHYNPYKVGDIVYNKNKCFNFKNNCGVVIRSNKVNFSIAIKWFHQKSDNFYNIDSYYAQTFLNIL